MSILILIVIAYLIVHTLCYRHHRRSGFGVFYSARGPFHTWWRVSRRI
jgi:hypothetical protein